MFILPILAFATVSTLLILAAATPITSPHPPPTGSVYVKFIALPKFIPLVISPLDSNGSSSDSPASWDKSIATLKLPSPIISLAAAAFKDIVTVPLLA